MSKLTRYLLVTAALYGPFVYAADPVATVEANRKIMYGTAAVRPTPDTFDLASRGMCYVATDTGAITEWTGTAWINAATCGGGAGAVSTSPAYTTIVDSSGDSAVDAAANAVRTTAYVTENTSTGTSSNVSATALGVGGAGVELIDGYDLGAISATYCTLAITNSADGAIDAAKIYLLPSGETNLTAPNVLGGSTGVTSAHYTSPAVGSPLEWATTWVTSTGVIGDGDLTDLAASSVWVGKLNVAGADKLYVEISGDGAVDTTYRLSCN